VKPKSRCKTVVRWIAATGVMALLLWLGGTYAVTRELTRRARALHAETLPRSIGGDWESLRIATEDGESLGAWYRAGSPDRPVVLLLHGNGGSRRGCELIPDPKSRPTFLAFKSHLSRQVHDENAKTTYQN
jgi:uncharacterized protein